jgi:flagellar assembly protein FliH
LYRVLKSISLRNTPVVIATVPPVIHYESDLSPSAEEIQQAELECQLKKAQTECEAILADAHNKAEEILAQTAEESQNLKSEAMEKGRQEGYDAGFASGLEAGKDQVRQDMSDELSRSAQQASQLLLAAQQEGHDMILNAQQQILELAVEVARKILAHEIEENSTVVLPMVRAALEKVRDQQEVSVRVHSVDYEFIMNSRQDLQVLIGREQPILVQADDSVPRGNCLIDTTSGTVDARIDTQLDSIRKALQEVSA